MPSNYLILCRPLLLLPSVFPSIRVFSSESVLRIRWPKYWSFSFNISPFSEYSGLTCFRIDWFDPLQSKGLSRVFSNTTVQKYQDTSHSHSKRVKVERKRPVYSVSYTLQTTLGFKPTNTLGDSASLSGLWTPPFNFHLFFSRKGSTVLSACFLSV